MKDILLALISEVQDLRANLAVIASRVENHPSIADARDAKTLARQEQAKFYDELRKKVEAL